MKAAAYHGGEDFNLRDVLVAGHSMKHEERIALFDDFLSYLNAHNESLYMREIRSAADREVLVGNGAAGELRRMLMFGSNNYLGLANHPYVKERVCETIRSFGAGIGGPPLLNGHTQLHAELEHRIASFKHADDAVLFSSGYNANVGLLTALLTKQDVLLYDEYSHASFIDGITMSRARAISFRHNDVDALRRLLEAHASEEHDTYVGVEGVYSMDGDCAPLDRIVPLCRKYGARIILDDAHGTGVLGDHGRGTADAFGVGSEIDITMGTFSKAFGAVGGFVAGERRLVQYLRFFARSHMFSAALPPPVIATVLAGLDLIEHDTELLGRLRANIDYALGEFRAKGFDVKTDSAIIALRIPERIDIRKAAYAFHCAGVFVNSIEYPAVPVRQQRFRISLMASHTKEDIDRLIDCAATVLEKRTNGY